MIHVERVGPRTVRAAARVLAAAFADDPAVARLVPPGARRRQARLVAVFTGDVRSVGRAGVDVARRGPGGEVVGAAVWRTPAGGEPALRHPLVALRAAWALRPAGLRAARRYDSAVAEHLPAGPCWHLHDIGASPSARGLGVGRALLEHRLAEVDATGQQAFLEATTPASRRLYERHGFVAVGEITDPVGAGAVPMRRPPRRPPLRPPHRRGG
ncbi:GNAT family N-acetyltransferase [Nocardioides sp. CPCC 205120]|uniref:GNAT family N-acetyltransferase n=1 Tax=Nocardioides sp. CPCC 205120 TaxID=3406462 RepID=UPI003B512691